MPVLSLENIPVLLNDIESRIDMDLKNMFGLIKSDCSNNTKLSESLDYSLDITGKLKRPLLLYLSYLVIKNTLMDDLKYVAASIELMHTASLIHDDIIDEGIKRRGRDSVYSRFGRPTAVLTGDYLIFCAQKLIAEVDKDNQTVLNILSRLNDTYRNMCIGQSLEESLVANLETSQEQYFEVILYKTAGFFSAVCETGAVLAGGTISEVKALREYGINLGMAYQIKDDLTSLIENSIDHDKSIETDMDRKLITLPILLAYQECSESEKNTLRFQFDSKNETNFDIVKKIILNTDVVNKINMLIQMYISRSLEALDVLEDNPYRKYLKAFAKSVL